MAKKKATKKSKGLGDSIEKVTKATGIKKAVEVFSKITGIDCKCEERKEFLNKEFSYGKKPNCMAKDQHSDWKEFKKTKANAINGKQRTLIATIHASLFNHKVVEPCTCAPKAWINMIAEIDKVYSTYES